MILAEENGLLLSSESQSARFKSLVALAPLFVKN